MLCLLLLLPLIRTPAAAADLDERVHKLIDASGAEVAVAMRTLDGTRELLIDPDKTFHAASTMKVPSDRALPAGQAGRCARRSPIKNEFHSIVDGSVYQLSVGDAPTRRSTGRSAGPCRCATC